MNRTLLCLLAPCLLAPRLLAPCLLALSGLPVLAQSESDLGAVKNYLLGQTAALVTATGDLETSAAQYYALAEAADFDYETLWTEHQAEVAALLLDAREAWMTSSPTYEEMEGVVAGTPSLAQFDVDIDAGTSAAEDPQSAVSFDVALPSGEVLEKPGNLMGVTESTLYGTFEAYSSGVQADLEGDGELQFSDLLPDANVLAGSAAKLAEVARDLYTSAQAWKPTEADAFTALAVMVPTMTEYFASWRDSRFVIGDDSGQRDFVAISRLADIGDILGGLQVVLGSVTPQIDTVDAAQSDQLEARLQGLIDFVGSIYAEEQSGKRFTPEEADVLGAEAQDQATAITGQLTQVAGALGVALAN